MTFYALAVCVCFAVQFLVMAGTSLLVWPLRRIFSPIVTTLLRATAPSTVANLLFAIRTLPLFLGLGVTAGLVLPAFLKFEPRATSETMGAKLLLLSAAGALIRAAMPIRGGRVLRATARVEMRWRAGSEERRANIAGSRIPLHYVEGVPSLLAVTGFFRPKIFVAREVARMLSAEEFSAALAHEMAHVSFLDNLKQLLLKMTRPPRWLGWLFPGNATMDDAAWAGAAEIAADEAALANGASALDLAAALVKIGMLQRGPAVGDQVAASHLLPDVPGASVGMRVMRLQQALKGELSCQQIKSGRKYWQALFLVALPVLAYAGCVNAVLPVIHQALEVLVR